MAQLVINDRWVAEELSKLGLDYIRKCRSLERLDESVSRLLAAIG
jgi:hypothetical protein